MRKVKLIIGLLLIFVLLIAGCDNHQPYIKVDNPNPTIINGQYSSIITLTIQANYTAQDSIKIVLNSPNEDHIKFVDENNNPIPNSTINIKIDSSQPVISTQSTKFKVFANKDSWQDSYSATAKIKEPNKNLETQIKINVL